MASVNLMGTYFTGICIEHQLLIFWFTRRGVTWRQGQLLKHDRVGAGAQVGGKSVRCGDDVVLLSGTCWPDSKIFEFLVNFTFVFQRLKARQKVDFNYSLYYVIKSSAIIFQMNVILNIIIFLLLMHLVGTTKLRLLMLKYASVPTIYRYRR